MPKIRVMIAQFPFGGSTRVDTSDWVQETVLKCYKDERIGPGNVQMWRKDTTPITSGRNACLIAAERENVDILAMIDSDMCPDYELYTNPPTPGAKPFWESSLDFMLQHDGPCIVAAPYCGPPPVEMPYFFKFEDSESGLPRPNCSMRLEAFPRSEAAVLRGMIPCAALPTGVMLIDMRIIRGGWKGQKPMAHPRFYYEWKGDGEKCKVCGVPKMGEQHTRASTEDVAFTRDVTYLGYPIYANCDAWAAHIKTKYVLRPMPMSADAVPKWMVERAKELALAEIEEGRRKGLPADAVEVAPGMFASPMPTNRLPANGFHQSAGSVKMGVSPIDSLAKNGILAEG